MKRSPWITGVVVLQLLYVLVLLTLPIYLLALTRATVVRTGPDAAEDVSGLRIAAAILGGPGIVALVGWFGLWREKLWGWWLIFLTDLGLVGVFMYSLVDDGWNNIDPDVVILTVISLTPVILLLLPWVRQFYWRSGGTGFPPVPAETPQV